LAAQDSGLAGVGTREELIAMLENKARLLRWDIVRMTGLAGSGHPGGSLSAADVVAALYFQVLRHRPAEAGWPDRDRFILSKGHACPVLYAALAETGYFARDTLWTLRKLGSILQGHPDMKRTPGVEISSGSLGHGLAAACGMALGLRMDKRPSDVYVVLGDGEAQEGEVWEAAMFAAQNCLGNLVGVIDMNGLQIDGSCEDIVSLEPVADKWRSFGWHTIEIDGHDMGAVLSALEAARDHRGGPAMIVARTVKGKGVSFMEHQVDFHGKAPSPEQMETALAEIEATGSLG